MHLNQEIFQINLNVKRRIEKGLLKSENWITFTDNKGYEKQLNMKTLHNSSEMKFNIN